MSCVTDIPRLAKLLDKVEINFSSISNKTLQDILEMIMFCYFDTLRVEFKNPPDNRLVI